MSGVYHAINKGNDINPRLKLICNSLKNNTRQAGTDEPIPRIISGTDSRNYLLLFARVIQINVRERWPFVHIYKTPQLVDLLYYNQTSRHSSDYGGPVC